MALFKLCKRLGRISFFLMVFALAVRNASYSSVLITKTVETAIKNAPSLRSANEASSNVSPNKPEANQLATPNIKLSKGHTKPQLPSKEMEQGHVVATSNTEDRVVVPFGKTLEPQRSTTEWIELKPEASKVSLDVRPHSGMTAVVKMNNLQTVCKAHNGIGHIQCLVSTVEGH